MCIRDRTTDEIGYLLENHELEISVDGGKELFSINEIEVLQEGREGSNTISNSKSVRIILIGRFIHLF